MKSKAATKKPASRLGASDLLAFIGDWGHPEWVVLAAEAPMEKVSSLLAAAHSARKMQHTVPLRAPRKQDNEIAPLAAVLQCADSPWSVVLVSLCLPIESADVEAAQNDARRLSSKLKTRALAFVGEDTSAAMGYHLYRNGKEIERKEWDQSKTRAADKTFAELGLYLPACFPCTAHGEAWLAVTSASMSRVQRADLITLGEPPEARQAEALLNAVLKNKLADVRLLLRKGAKPTHNALHKAIRKANWSGKHDVLKELLKGMSDQRIPLKPSAISDALSAGGPKSLSRRIEVVKLLLAAGADINGEGGEALRTAIRQEDPALLKFLLDAGADANASKSWRSTPLHCAAHLGQVECAKLLLQAGARPDPVDEKGATPAQRATEYGHKDLAKLLQETARA